MSESYVTDYEKHLGQLRAHLAGNTDHALSPSFILPAGYWTSREKDLFFHALAVHSRLRPDLIADAVKSKNVLDVCAYIDALDEAAAAVLPQASSLRSRLEGAMEVSDSWIQYEEEQAGALSKLEPEWEEEEEEHRRSVLLASRFQDEHTYWSWKEEEEGRWRKQDTLAQLDIHHLRIMDRLIRNQGVVSHETEPPLTEPPMYRSHDGLIDPALLVLSASKPILQHFPSPDHTIPDQGPGRPPNLFVHTLPSSPVANNHELPPDPPLSPASRRRLVNRLHMRKKRAQAAGKEANMTTAKLTRGRKKTRVYIPKPRPKKYKPRKPKNLNQERSLGGEADVHPPTPNAEPSENLNQERSLDMENEEADAHPLKSNAGPSAPGSPSSIQPANLGNEDGEPVVDTPYHSKGGVTLPYRIMNTFKNQGIDGDTLAESGFDIFNLSMIGKLMGLFHRAYAEAEEKSISSSISSDTIKLLRNILLDFTSTTVHRAISMREQEVILKRKIKVWRLDKEDEITSGNVLDALQMQGLNRHNLFSEFSEDSPPDASSPVDGGTADDDHATERRFDEDESMFHARLTAHREIIPPFVPLPGRPDDASLMPAETNMDDLLAELDGESKLEELDHELEARYEESLWEACRAE
ncbi:hypothetical protein C8R44DRAFT_748804 [Mycena epipterygia]|nr:hypothetical protein C8R44DRAFT_748804 [Mycena epipterygia]